MGTRIHVLLDHKIPNPRDTAAVCSLLAPSLSAAFAVRQYWLTADPEDYYDPVETWERGMPIAQFETYEAPGRIILRIGEKAAKISTGGRWRGFLSIEPLRQVHLRAFRDIARLLGGTRLTYFPDDDFVDDALYRENASQGECVELLLKRYGPPQPSVESIAPKIAAAVEKGVPQVWYVEDL